MSDATQSRPTLIDALNLPMSLALRPLLNERQFRDGAKERGHWLPDRSMLEDLHRRGLIVPALGVRRPVRQLRAEARREPHFRWEILLQAPPSEAPELRHRVGAGLVFLPTEQRFRPWRRAERQHDDVNYRTFDYLYSHYQLTLLHLVRGANEAHASRWRGKGWREHADAVAGQARRQAAYVSSAVALLTALEPYYLNRVRAVSMPARYDGDEEWWEKGHRSYDAGDLFRWLAWPRDELVALAEWLINQASMIDPLHRWLDLVALASGDRWDELRGQARLAVDLREAAELLLRFVEHLSQLGLCEPLPVNGGRWTHPLNERLRPERADLDAVLAEYGLSPHPAVLLVLEGPTEIRAAEALMPLLGIPNRSDFIRLFDYGGATKKNPDLLPRFLRPSLREHSSEFARSLAPPIRIIIVMDQEGLFADPDRRSTQRDAWVKRLYNSLPRAFQNQVIFRELENLVEVRTWADDARNFEFAHFTDEELASALVATGRTPRRATQESLTEAIGGARRTGKSLDTLQASWKDPPPKEQLWDHLLPILEGRVRGVADEAIDTIPLAAVLVDAAQRAARGKRRTLMRRAERAAHDGLIPVVM